MEKNKTHHSIIIITTFTAGTLYLLFLLFASTGSPLHDEVGHYLISRDALHIPLHFFDIWGRTFNTVLYCIPAQFGLYGVRLLSLLLALVTALLTLEVAKECKIRYYFLVPLFLWFQPWFADYSYQCLTEVPFSLIMIGGVYLFNKNRLKSASFVIGLLPLVRHEGIALAGLVSVYMLYRKNWLPAAITFLPLAMYNGIYFAFQHTLPCSTYFDTHPTNLYGIGTWYHFLIRLPHPRAAGIPIMLLVTGSIIPLIRGKCNLPVYCWYFTYFAVHTVLYRFGLFASGGYKVFLLPLAPIIAIAAAQGLEWFTTVIFTSMKGLPETAHRVLAERQVLILICAICLFWTFFFVRPYPLDKEGKAFKQATDWIKKEGLQTRNLVSTHVYFYHFLPHRVPPVTLWEKFPPLAEMPSGTVVVWDRHYSDRWGIDYQYLAARNNEWKKLREFGEGTVIIFERISSQ